MTEKAIKGASSFESASDETFLMVCDPCKFEGKEEKVAGFCTSCQEYLCRDCLRSHKKYKLFRTHETLQGPAIKSVSRKQPAEICDLHGERIVKYCKTHDVTLCEICNSMNHNKCKAVMNIHEVSNKEAGQSQVSNYLLQIRTLIGKLKVLEEQHSRELQNLLEQKDRCVKEINSLRNTINNILDDLETEFSKTLDRAIQEETKHNEDQTMKIKNTLRGLEIGVRDIERAKNTGPEHAFIAMKKLSVNNATSALWEVQQKQHAVHIVFEPDAMICNLTKKLKELGTLSVTRTNVLAEDFRERKIEKIGVYSVKGVVDGNVFSCHITDSLFLPKDELLLCDNNSGKVKLLDKTFKLQTSLKLPGKPWGAALITDKKVAVTLPDQKTIQFLNIDRQLKLLDGQSIKTEKKFWGVANHNNQLYVSCHDNPGNYQIIVLNMTGQLVSRIPGCAKVKDPCHIAVDSEGRIYVSDRTTHTVTCMEASGKTVYTRAKTDTSLFLPGSLLVDNKQNVYLCGQESHNIQIIAADGKLYRSLVKKGEGLSYPTALAFRNSDMTLAVGQYNNNIVCFRLV